MRSVPKVETESREPLQTPQLGRSENALEEVIENVPVMCLWEECSDSSFSSGKSRGLVV